MQEKGIISFYPFSFRKRTVRLFLNSPIMNIENFHVTGMTCTLALPQTVCQRGTSNV